MRVSRSALAIVFALGAEGCVLPRPDAKLEPEEGAFVAVLSGQMPSPIDTVARHAWIVTHHSGSTHFRRFEMGGGSERDPFEDFAAGDVMLHGKLEMTDEELTRTEACLSTAKEAYHKKHPHYFPIPGPNSNTLVAFLLRECDLHVELPATAIGRDYAGPVGAQVTESGTGVQVGSIPLGLRMGLREGVEVQLFGLPVGVHTYPLGLTVPVNPGRVGFADDAHVTRQCKCHADRTPPWTPDRGVGNVAIFGAGGGTQKPSRAGGFVGQGTVGLTARAIYGGRVGYGMGLDFGLGVGAPFGFAGHAHLYPVGIGYALSPTGYVGFFSGIGTSGVSSTVPAGLDLPQEVRLEFDVGRRARISLVAAGIFVAGEPRRRQGRLLFDETRFGAYARIGKLHVEDDFILSSGTYFGFERREIMGSPYLGMVFGTEIGSSLKK
ncbi:MAG: DUF3750 domain-containing protein [Polyangiaceae bacterium]